MRVRTFAKRLRGYWMWFGATVLLVVIVVAIWDDENDYISEARINYSCAINGTYTSDVSAGCSYFGKNFAISLSEDWNGWEFNYIHLHLPHHIEAGTHSLKIVDSDLEAQLSLGYSTLAGQIYKQGEWYFLDSDVELSEKYISGTLSLDAIPNKPKKLIQGNFEIIFTDLEIRGEFKFRTKGANYDCLK